MPSHLAQGQELHGSSAGKKGGGGGKMKRGGGDGHSKMTANRNNNNNNSNNIKYIATMPGDNHYLTKYRAKAFPDLVGNSTDFTRLGSQLLSLGGQGNSNAAGTSYDLTSQTHPGGVVSGAETIMQQGQAQHHQGLASELKSSSGESTVGYSDDTNW